MTPIVIVWIAINATAALVTVFNLADALADRRNVLLHNGPSRTLVARDDVRREALRLAIQLLLLSAAIPIPDVAVVTLVGASLALLIQGVLDRRTRRQLAAIQMSAVLSEREIIERDAVTASELVRTTALAVAAALEAPGHTSERSAEALEQTAQATTRIADAATAAPPTESRGEA